MTWLCPRPCENKTADGYCGTSWCINPMYSNIGTANEKLMGGLRKTTNADRIRAMTDEEIEKWFWWMHKEMMRYTDSRVFLHDWLKQEAQCTSE